MATPLHCSQNHSPLGDGESPTHWKWNHSMRQSLCSQTIMSPHSGPPQIHHNSALSRGASPDFLNAFPFLFAVAFWAPAWQCFLASHRCLTHISTSLEQRFVRFPLLIALFQSSSYFWKIMHASLSRLKHSLTVTSTSCFCRFLSWPRPHVGTEPKVEISQMNHP